MINVLASVGVSNEDLTAVSMVLDRYRATKTGAEHDDVICQDADCTNSPFYIKVANGYFNPPYVTMPKYTSVIFSKYDLSPHIVTELSENGTKNELSFAPRMYSPHIRPRCSLFRAFNVCG